MKPKKRFGQHFLTSQSAISRIISLSKVKKGDKVLEIGPGKGALTKMLVSLEVELTVIEFDRDMVEHIQEHYPSVRVIHEDASKVDWDALIPEGERWFCLSNLPYNVGTKIVQNLLIQRHLFHSFTFMLQKEVGLRMLAMENNRKRGSLSSFVQMHAEVRKGFLVPPGAFYPPPKVDSIVIHLLPKVNPLYSPVSLDTFQKVNRAIFSHQRKSLRNSLRAVFSKEEVLSVEEESGISFSLRPANLSNQEIADLVTIFEKTAGLC
jgi:16S rRNA (adenine1518-N6/adenine1519-N6)-dimethyltransferase